MTDVDTTPTAATEPNTAEKGSPLPRALAFSAAGGLLFGGLTQLGQSYLPDWLHSISNSGAPWVLIAVGLALLSRTARTACVSGMLALAALEIGYVLVAAMRDFPSAGTTVAFWLTAAVALGPMAGLAAYFLRVRRAPWDALGGGLVAGIVSGEGLVAYLTVRDTTSPGYWVAQMVIGVILLAFVGRRTRSAWALPAFAIGVGGLLATRLVPMFGA